MKACTFEAPVVAAAYGTELGIEARLSVPAAEVANVDAGAWSSILQTIEALFCRASPSLSSYFYHVLGEDADNELDD